MMADGTGGSGGSSAWSSRRGVQWLGQWFGGASWREFWLGESRFLNSPLNYELLLSSTCSEYSKHRSFLMHHSFGKFLQSWGYVQKLPLLHLMLSYYGWERWGVWIAILFIFLPFLFNYILAEGDNTTHCFPTMFHCWNPCCFVRSANILKVLAWIPHCGFSNCGMCTTTGTPTIVCWYTSLIEN